MAKNVLPFPVSDQPAYSIRAEGAKGVIDIRGTIGLERIYQDYGFEAGGTLTDFESDLRALGDVTEIELNVYSLGGDVLTALGIHNVLARHKARVIANVDGIAASAATILILAADEIRIPENAYLMIHNATAGVWGDYRDAEKIAADLRKWSRDIANLYAARIEDNTGGPRAAILADVIEKMDAETWLTGAEAKALGLVETVTGRVELAADAALCLTPAMRGDRIPEAVRALLVDRAPVAPAATAAPPTMETTPATDPAPAAVEPIATAAPAEPVTEPIEPAVNAEAEPVSVPVASAEPVAPVAPAAEALTLDAIRAAISAELQPIAARLEKAEGEIARQESLRASGVPVNAWGNQRPTDTAEPSANGEIPVDTTKLTAAQLTAMGRKKMFPNAPAH